MDFFPPLIDRYNRKIQNVRISITDRCNLRCKYCMPNEHIEWVEKTEILSFEEIIRLVSIFYRTGIRNFRLTGGEPTVRKNLSDLIRSLKEQFNDISIALTTNGINLVNLAAELKKAGLDRINISLDTLDPDKFSEITQRDELEKVLAGIKKAIEVKFDKIKINAVALRNFNTDDDSIKTFIDFSEKNNVEIRYIEIMPFSGNNFMDIRENGFISSKEILNQIQSNEDLIPLPLENSSQTSRIWTLKGTNARIGFISSVTDSFCENCDRVRITADGNFRPCLHSSREYPLKTLLRNGATDNEILEQIRSGLNEKWKEHPDFMSLKYLPPIDDREMIRIGG